MGCGARAALLRGLLCWQQRGCGRHLAGCTSLGCCLCMHQAAVQLSQPWLHAHTLLCVGQPGKRCCLVLSAGYTVAAAAGADQSAGGALGHENSVGLAEQQLNSAMRELGMSEGGACLCIGLCESEAEAELNHAQGSTAVAGAAYADTAAGLAYIPCRWLLCRHFRRVCTRVHVQRSTAHLLHRYSRPPC